MGDAKTLGENANVVRIMSIHKSKGLEFPVVICSGMGKKFNTQDLTKKILYHHKLGYGPELVDYDRRISYPSIAKEALKSRIRIENLSEEMRVLYVAFTRPKEKLIITGSTTNVEKRIKSWANGIDGTGRVPQYQIVKGSNFLDWIMPSILKHNDLENIRQEVDLDIERIEAHPSNWHAKIWNKEDVAITLKEEEDKDSIEEILEKLDASKADSDYYEDIKEKLDYDYPFKSSITTPASISVSEIKKVQNNHEEEYSKDIFSNQVNLKKPLFLQEKESKDKISASQRGTIVHLVMELLDLDKVNNIDEIEKQIDGFISKGSLTTKQASVINPYKIYKFFKSDMGKRMLNSEFIKREQAIYAQIKMKDVYMYDDLIQDSSTDKYDEESLMLRGIIDAYFEEDGEIVIVDYKTDFVNEENKHEVVNRYKKQLELYSKVLEDLTGKKVKEKCVYLFGIDDSISY